MRFSLDKIHAKIIDIPIKSRAGARKSGKIMTKRASLSVNAISSVVASLPRRGQQAMKKKKRMRYIHGVGGGCDAIWHIAHASCHTAPLYTRVNLIISSDRGKWELAARARICADYRFPGRKLLVRLAAIKDLSGWLISSPTCHYRRLVLIGLPPLILTANFSLTPLSFLCSSFSGIGVDY